MTEPRKTPRTDAAWLEHISTVSRDTVGFREHASDLEIETQELAEALEEIATALDKQAKVSRFHEMNGTAAVLESQVHHANSALARHRAKQEVGT